MPNWKKLIVSGSDANLSNLNVDNAVTASFFVGDGSALTGITSNVVETATITDTFTSQTSVAVSHNFNTRNILVSVYDNSFNQVIPASVVLTDLDTVTVGFDSSTSGTVVVAKGGHVVSGSTAADIIGQDITDLGGLVISGSILPNTTEVFDLGSTSKRWRDLYLSGSTIDLGGTKISRDSTTGDIEFKDAGGNRKSLKVDELTIGTGASTRKIKVSNGKFQFTNIAEEIEDTDTGHLVPVTSNTYDLGTPSSRYRDLNLSGNITINGTVDGVDISNFSSSVATGLANTTADYTELTNIPAGIVSGSTQVDYTFIQNKPSIPTSNSQLTNGAGYTAFTANQLLDSGSSVTFNTVTATSLTETSALRFKENIHEDIDSSIIDKLRPVSYDWKEDKEKDYGFIAEEVNELDSTLTTENEDGEMLGIKYTKLIPFLVKKIQEQEERIKQLENGNS